MVSFPIAARRGSEFALSAERPSQAGATRGGYPTHIPLPPPDDDSVRGKDGREDTEAANKEAIWQPVKEWADSSAIS